MTRHANMLGWYLLGIGAIQGGMLAFLGEIPVYADPQAGVAMAVTFNDFAAQDEILFLLWSFAALRLLLFGALIVFQRRPLRSYLASEIMLGGPTALLIGQLLLDYPSGLARVLLWSIILVFAIYTVLPVTLALSLLQRGRVQGSPMTQKTA